MCCSRRCNGWGTRSIISIFRERCPPSPRTYLDLLRDMVENFLFHGFDRILIINGHGGNIVPSLQAMFELRQKYRDWKNQLLISATYWDTAEPHQNEFEQQQMGHACEWETSMMMAIRPELVKDHKAAGIHPFRKAVRTGKSRLGDERPQRTRTRGQSDGGLSRKGRASVRSLC